MSHFAHIIEPPDKTITIRQASLGYGDSEGSFVYFEKENLILWYDGNDKDVDQGFGKCGWTYIQSFV